MTSSQLVMRHSTGLVKGVINQTFPGSSPASPDIVVRLLKKKMLISHDSYQAFTWSTGALSSV